MKTITYFIALTLAVASQVQVASAANEHTTIVTVHADGTSQITTDYTQPRSQAEMQVKMWVRYSQNGGNDGDDMETPKPEAKEQASKPLSDQELAAKMREMLESQGNSGEDEDAAGKIDALEVGKDNVRIKQTRSLSTLEKLLAAGLANGEGGMSFSTMRFEKNTNGLLQVTLSSDPNMKRYLQKTRQYMKLSGLTNEFRLVLPGKVLTSGFSNIQDHATWFIVNPKDNASLDASMHLYEAPVIITAELGGLKLDQPLDSKTARLTVRRSAKGEGELPITEAGPGFVAESASVTTSTVYYFPGGEKFIESSGVYAGQPGTVVQAKLFAPKGRSLRSVSGVQVTKAIDDKGRAIPPAPGNEESEENEQTIISDNGQPQTGSTKISMRLALPERDAQSIQELSAEAVAVTVRGWKELLVTNTAGETDLSAVLPGTKLAISELKSKNGRTTAQLEIKGSTQIRQIEITSKPMNPDQMDGGMVNVNVTERGFKTTGDQSTRKVLLQIFSYGINGAGPSTNPAPFLVRFPEDVRRERVKFKLTALDLF